MATIIQEKTKAARSAQDPLWYKDAIIYQLHVRSFYDSNGDGIGDFSGLARKLDYIQRSGRHGHLAAALLPFSAQGRRIRHRRLHQRPSHRTATFATSRLSQRSASRDLRVITELVINHTSDQHPWFQRARRAKPGSNWRDFYVWSDDAGHATRTPASSSRISNRPTGPGTRWPKPTTGIASIHTSRT